MKGFGIILSMDSNAHSISFGPDANKQGEDLNLLIAQCNLSIANFSHDPTFESRGVKTHLSSRLAVSLYRTTGLVNKMVMTITPSVLLLMSTLLLPPLPGSGIN